MLELMHSATRTELLAAGIPRRALSRAVAVGELIRARRDRYVSGSAPNAVVKAVRVGGRVTCLSLLDLLDVFVFSCEVVHLHVARGSSRLRSPHSRDKRLEASTDRSARLHWSPLTRAAEGTSACVGLVDALIHAVQCQEPRHAIASVDSALNMGLIGSSDIADIFSALPAKFAALRPLIDGRAQSGTETLVRLMARSLGCDIALQVEFEDVGFVDLVLDGWLVVECDSKEFHSSWDQQLVDYQRDLALAAQGYSVFRVTAADILYRPDKVTQSLAGLIRSRRAAVGRAA